MRVLILCAALAAASADRIPGIPDTARDASEVRRCQPGFMHTYQNKPADPAHAYMSQAQARLPSGEVVESLRARSGHYAISFAQASDVCSQRGMSVCTPQQVQEGYLHELEICACSWASDGNMYYPMQTADQFCGNMAGVHNCGKKTYKGAVGDVFCCGVRDQAAGPGYGTCTKCPKGQWSNGHNAQGPCIKCYAGQYGVKEGAISATDGCRKCAAGTYNSNAGATSVAACVACATGKHSSAGATVCEGCRPGTKRDTASSTGCSECEAGRYSNAAGTSTCTACTAGQYQPSVGQTKCIECVAGKANADTAATSASKCTACVAGHYAIAGLPNCRACAAGRASATQAAESVNQCTSCAPGHFSAAGAAVCSPCAKGHFQDVSGALMCQTCAAGTYLDIEGAVFAHQCKPCPKGHWCAAGSSQPTPCASGSFHDVQGAAHAGFCRQCPVGTYSVDTTSVGGAESCENCSIGHYQDEKGQSECKQCDAGTIAPLEGGTDAASCEKCHAGRYQPEAAKWFCVQCGKGFYQPHDGSSACLRCPKGRAGSVRAATSLEAGCPECAAGQYQSQTAKTQCVACAAGKTSATVGAVSAATCCAGEACAQKQDCVMADWGQWSTCSQQCRARGQHAGKQTRSRGVKTPASGPGSKPCSAFQQSQSRSCGTNSCPVDCEYAASPGAWSTCTHSCGGGSSTRSRRMLRPSAHGGNCDMVATCDHAVCTKTGTCHKCIKEVAKCNAQSCDPRNLPRCHGEHVHCHIAQKTLHQTGAWQTDGSIGLTNACSRRWTYAYGNCHHCDTPAECAIKGIHKTLVVTHDRKYSGMHGQLNAFHCYRSESASAQDSCYCTCSMHPPCMSKRGVRLSNTPLIGNRWEKVWTQQECCNMCTNHPQCESFTWTKGLTCTLYEGSPVEVPIDPADPTFDRTFSGCQSGDFCQSDSVQGAVVRR